MISNADIEREYVAMALSPLYRTDALYQITAAEFYDQRLGSIFAAIEAAHARGAVIDPVTISEASGEAVETLRAMIADTPIVVTVDAHAEVIRHLALCRRALSVAEQLREVAGDRDYARLVEFVDKIPGQFANQYQQIEPGIEAQELSVMQFEHRWLIDGLMERADRWMVTGGEGRGKSTWLRQFAIMSASGIHPFRRHRIKPLKVLIVDLENSESQVSRSLQGLLSRAGEEYRPGSCFVKCRPQGMDLASRADVRWLDGLLSFHKPDLLVFGSLYKAYRGADGRSKGSEESAEMVANALDELRVRHDCALLIEAHAPHGEGADRAGLRPAGSSLWLRWPEVGFGLKVGGNGDADVVQWRGIRDRDRIAEWPKVFARGRVWPWEAILNSEVNR
jgi:replicative DNA helicase